MILQVKTRNSEYTLNQPNMTWERSKISDASGKIRSESGKLLEWPEVAVGTSMFLWVDAHDSTPDGHARTIITSRVTSLTEVAA